MGKRSSRHCWDITNCQVRESCPAYRTPGIPCWEIAKALNDYRTIYKVCEDCIVFLSLAENTLLTEQEIEIIMAHKGVCPLEAKALEVGEYGPQA